MIFELTPKGKFLYVGFLEIVQFSLVFVRAWVVTRLWAWFVVPVFGLLPLHFVPAMGLGLFVTFLLYRSPSFLKVLEDRKQKKVLQDVVGDWELYKQAARYNLKQNLSLLVSVLVVGWLMHLFM